MQPNTRTIVQRAITESAIVFNCKEGYRWATAAEQVQPKQLLVCFVCHLYSECGVQLSTNIAVAWMCLPDR